MSEPARPPKPSSTWGRWVALEVLYCVVALVVVVVLVRIAAEIAAGGAEVIAFAPASLPFFAVLLVIGPIAVLAVGLLRGHIGLILGTVLAAPVLYAWEKENFARETAAIEEAAAQVAHNDVWDQAAIDAALQAHDALVLVGGDSSFVEYQIRILAQTKYTLVLQNLTAKSHWAALAKVSDEVCLAPENRFMLLEFLAAGYIDTCAVSHPVASLDDALLVNSVSIGNFGLRVPHTPRQRFVGGAHEVFEVNHGARRLLGRRSHGSVQSALEPADEVIGFLFGLRLPSPTVGDFWEDDQKFLAGLLDISLDPSTKPGHDDPAEIARIAERFERDGVYGSFAQRIKEEARQSLNPAP